MASTIKKRGQGRAPLLWLVPLAVLALLALLLAPRLQAPLPPAAPAPWPTGGWQSSAPEAQGVDSARAAEALLAMRAQGIDIHSLLVVRNGWVVLDAAFYPYDGRTLHDMASVTKSIMPALVAIAAEQGRLDLDAPMLSFFPDRAIANRDARKERITVRHLASMSSGLDCTRERDEATLQEMVASDDWAQFILDRKVAWEPGTHFVYCSPAMHLLSPILQRATGMTALDFARQNLFAPLGIEEALWESDPQGYNNGWGDLYLHPRDMAKIGYLWLNGGAWDGRQVIPRAWAEASVAPQMAETDTEDGYGYGWWLSKDDLRVYSANGRGGQHIKVVPEWDLVVVTTGGGFEFDEIAPLLVATLVDMERPLPANPDGVAMLAAAVAAVAQPPAPQPVAPLPATARDISGKTFSFGPNPAEVETVALEFAGPDEATVHYKLFGGAQVVHAPVGLDGVYRMSPGDHGLPRGYRGSWADARTFLLEDDEIANNDHFTYVLRFADGRVLLSGQETAHDQSMQFEGRLREP